MINFNLKEILDSNNISQNKFSKMTKVRPNTINNIYNNSIRRLELDTLEKIMIKLEELGYDISDLIKLKKDDDIND